METTRSLKRRRNTITVQRRWRSGGPDSGGSSADDDCCTRETTLCRLVEYAADILTKFAEEADGRTANERIRRKRYHVGLDRKVMHKMSCKPKGGLMMDRK